MPAGNLFPEPRTRTARRGRRSTRWASATRSGSRSTERRRLPDRLLARLEVPQQFRGPAGTGRVEIVRKPGNYGWPLCYRPDLPYYRWDFNTSTTLGAAVRVRQPEARAGEHLALEHRPHCDAAGRPAGPLVLVPRQRHPGHAVPRVYDGRAAPARSSSPSSSPAASARTARPSTTTTRPTRARRSCRPTTTARSSSASSRATT